MADAAAPAPRERGWRRLLPALAAFVLLPVLPVAATVMPVRGTLLFVLAALAGCTLLGWWSGGRAAMAAMWCALAGWVLIGPGLPHTAYDALARGWILLLVGSFGAVSLVTGRRPFFGRALAAVALAGALASGVLLFSPKGMQRVSRVVRVEQQRRGEADLRWWQTNRAEAERQGWLKDPALADSAFDAQERNIRALPGAATTVYPALLALESLAALALGWALYHRVSRTRIGPPLAPLREFRFNDQLVWGVIAGLTAWALPSLEPLQGVGKNLALFFGALYALRGLGVLAWFLAPMRSVTGVLAGLALALLLGREVAFALGLVGVGDTWLDWRSRARGTT